MDPVLMPQLNHGQNSLQKEKGSSTGKAHALLTAGGSSIVVFQPHNGFQLLFAAHAACIGVAALQLAIDPATFFGGEDPVPT
ncbi:hypothetical protein llap_6606 [Limosa lapponica baueri]|uniref:Uncharacterized protein n=1 Tax=Limosa lapponica baueri TaxID=1758121 RepID=A0A2I0UAL0_LIMLA|nr:hypothetical protein llap_6606 [Limosa lapponica baueri]